MDGITHTGDTTMADLTRTQITIPDEMMDDAIARAFVVAGRRLATEHYSSLVNAWRRVANRTRSYWDPGS